MTYQDIEGWFDFENVYSYAVKNAKTDSVFVEVGACYGKSTAYMARLLAGRSPLAEDISLFYAVDIWSSNQQYRKFIQNMISCGVSRYINQYEHHLG